MLVHTSIRNFVLVDALDLDFGPAMNVITGETGAGKSIILNALNLTLGERSSPALLRTQNRRGEITAVFNIEKIPPVIEWLKKHEMFEGNECILRRTLIKETSRAFINGIPATLDQMRRLASLLISLQSQHAHQLLMNKRAHIRFIDDFGGLTSLVDQYSREYMKLLAIRRDLEECKKKEGTDERMVSLLKHEYSEIEQFTLPKSEYLQLEKRHNTLNNAEELLNTVQNINTILDGDGQGLVAQLSELQHTLLSAKDKILQELAPTLEQGRAAVEEVQSQLNTYSEGLQMDPELFSRLDAQMSDIHRIARKHRVEPEELEELKNKKIRELESMENNEEKIALLQEKEQKTLQACQDIAKSLTQKRKNAALLFDKQVMKYLHLLEMKCQFKTQFTRFQNLTAAGDHDVEFMLSAGQKNDFLPLRRIASGGELSRTALAINVVAAENSTIPCLVFDEVDSGIGGAVAEKLGQMLALLAKKVQILCITHQAQIAVHADAHYSVTKTSGENDVTSSIKVLDAVERKTEIGRMIGGAGLKDDALDYAGKLIERARQDAD